jgi:two-component system cell cycle sensor histidine kinase/response regulator CckA
MAYLYVSVGYSIVNIFLAFVVFAKSWRNLLSQFYAFCVSCLVGLGVIAYLLSHPQPGLPLRVLEQASAFLFAVFPFFFLHFMLIFVRRYEILSSKVVIVAIYFAALFGYLVVLLGYIPNPFLDIHAAASNGYTYYITWMSILFAIGIALLYSLVGGFGERGIKKNALFASLALVMLLLPTPFTLTVFSKLSDKSSHLYFAASTVSLAVLVYIVFRHRLTINTPYQAMKSALAAMNDILFKTNTHFEIEMVQGAVLPLLGYEDIELVGHSIKEFIPHDGLLEKYRKYVFSNKMKEAFFDAEVACKNGSRLPMEISFTPVWTNEEITGFVGVGRNISERRRAERALHDSEARYRSLFENNPNPMWVYEVATMTILVMNDAAITQYGYTRQEFLKLVMTDILTPECIPMLPKPGNVETLMSTTGWKHRKKDGSVMDVELTSHALDFGGRPARLVLINDVTERLRAEESLRASEEKYRRFFEDDLTGDAVTRPDGSLVSCNPAFLRIFGFGSEEQALRNNIADLYPSPGAYRAFLRLVRERRKLEYFEAELVRLDGAAVHVVQNVIGTFDNAGELVEIKSYTFDNTERKKLEEQLRQAQKMENLGTLAGGIAHDFNNILAIILANASLLKNIKQYPGKFETSVDTIHKAVERASGMVRQLMTFARKTEVLFETVELNRAVNDLVGMLESTFPKTITVEVSLEDNLPTIIADPNQIHQVLLNLCVNARDAISPRGQVEVEKGTITIVTKTVDGDTVRFRYPEAVAERYIIVTVSDTGVGMNEATRQRIFEPFFTTKDPGKGTGLGLAVVYGVVRSHRGFVDVESKLGQGTTFMLYFPVQISELMSTEEGNAGEEESYAGSETILLVEDEELLLDSLKVLLEGKGYQVLTAKDGEQAVEMYARHQDQIAFVLSDMGIPKISGWEAFQRMKKINPRVRVIFGSGHIDPNFRVKMLQAGAIDFLQKPYIPAEVLKRIREVLKN